jgi:hypothetical protein
MAAKVTSQGQDKGTFFITSQKDEVVRASVVKEAANLNGNERFVHKRANSQSILKYIVNISYFAVYLIRLQSEYIANVKRG